MNRGKPSTPVGRRDLENSAGHFVGPFAGFVGPYGASVALVPTWKLDRQGMSDGTPRVKPSFPELAPFLRESQTVSFRKVIRHPDFRLARGPWRNENLLWPLMVLGQWSRCECAPVAPPQQHVAVHVFAEMQIPALGGAGHRADAHISQKTGQWQGRHALSSASTSTVLP